MTHLFVDISAHGYGHLAQTAPVLNRLGERHTDLKLTVRSGLPRTQLQKIIQCQFTHLSESSDFGMIMLNALDVDVKASYARYHDFHVDWHSRVQKDALYISSLRPDLVISNISYLALAAARQANIPCMALCSLNWADIFYPYYQNNDEATVIYSEMRSAYCGANLFLRPIPGMPMPDMPNLQAIGPIARRGLNRRTAINNHYSLDPASILVLVAMGGIDMQLNAEAWPSVPGVFYLAPRSSGLISRVDILDMDTINTSFIDLVASCDAMIAKSSYGAFTEAAVNGIPVLYATRQGWPEEPCLRAWLHGQVPAQAITREALDQGRFGPVLADLLSQTRPSPIEPSGIEDAVSAIEAALGLGSNG